ncbi:hypothetical protein V1283_007392 [Bradyrhizobium sp. AZCC 2262]
MVPHVAARKTLQRLYEISFIPPKDFCNNIDPELTFLVLFGLPLLGDSKSV